MQISSKNIQKKEVHRQIALAIWMAESAYTMLKNEIIRLSVIQY